MVKAVFSVFAIHDSPVMEFQDVSGKTIGQGTVTITG